MKPLIYAIILVLSGETNPLNCWLRKFNGRIGPSVPAVVVARHCRIHGPTSVDRQDGFTEPCFQ